MAYNTLKAVRRVRAEFDGNVAMTPQRRRSDRDPSLKLALYEPEPRNRSESRLILYFAAVLVCTALGVGLENMRLPGAAWSLFIVGAAFLSAAVRALFVKPERNAKQ